MSKDIPEFFSAMSKDIPEFFSAMPKDIPEFFQRCRKTLPEFFSSDVERHLPILNQCSTGYRLQMNAMSPSGQVHRSLVRAGTALLETALES
jgi:hypothetical protein